jgi:predicted nucleic acid-binding protein
MKRTYIDANVLIAAFQGDESISRQAMEVLSDPERILVVSDYLRLEVLPKPTFHKRLEEVAFMESVLNDASETIPSFPEVTAQALQLASEYDITPMDAIHVGVALIAKVDELVTMEKPTKPMCRVKEVTVTSLYPNAKKRKKDGHNLTSAKSG